MLYSISALNLSDGKISVVKSDFSSGSNEENRTLLQNQVYLSKDSII